MFGSTYCDGPAGQQCPTWPQGGHKGRQREPRGVVVNGRYYPKMVSKELRPPGASTYLSQVCRVRPAIGRPFILPRESLSGLAEGVSGDFTHEKSVVRDKEKAWRPKRNPT
ncbi:hypothetical protein N1851_000051 [Merluccius polli]|uniref:Uncharacterized protein n=1 Tax=Merluccius polli TaxID=89951 RepID=A0AA47PC43_MERPO|nr:hypothetical protein N1851_000051 [Merluccius polli]